MKDLVIPSHILIETVVGICNYRCIMCPIEESVRREIMTNETFIKILTKLQPYLAHQRFLSICGLGESLIDKKVHEKIEAAKKFGFRGIGIYTNGELLSEETSVKLLTSELDSLIISIDGVTQSVQKSIRVRSHLSTVVSNVEQFIEIREEKKSKTKVIVRFTRQELNKHEENDFCDFWRPRIRSEYGDIISIYSVHNFGRAAPDFKDKLSDNMLDRIRRGKLKCNEIYENLLIAWDGSIKFCCGDQFGRYYIGNILYDDLAKLYNSRQYIDYRRMMEEGKILNLEFCRNCSVPYSVVTKEVHR